MASLAAVAILTVIAWRLGFRGQPKLDAAMARQEAAAVSPGFRPSDVLMSADGRSALVYGEAGGIALVHGLGDGWIVRAISASALAVLPCGTLHIHVGEPMLRRVHFPPCGPLPDWLKLAA